MPGHGTGPWWNFARNCWAKAEWIHTFGSPIWRFCRTPQLDRIVRKWQHTQNFNPLTCSTKTAIKFFWSRFFCRIHCNLHVAFVVTTHWQLWQEDLKAAITKVSHGEAPVKRASPVVGVPRGSKRIQEDHQMRIWWCAFISFIWFEVWDGCCVLFLVNPERMIWLFRWVGCWVVDVLLWQHSNSETLPLNPSRTPAQIESEDEAPLGVFHGSCGCSSHRCLQQVYSLYSFRVSCTLSSICHPFANI